MDVKLNDLKVGDLGNFRIANKGNVAIGVGADAAQTGLPQEVAGIRVGKDVSSLIFLHACAGGSRTSGRRARPARRKIFTALWPIR